MQNETNNNMTTLELLKEQARQIRTQKTERKASIKNVMILKGFQSYEMNESTLDNILNAVGVSKEFGFDVWASKTSFGVKVKELVKELVNG
jgi:membrane-bound lytic murein transglycosylase B